MLIIKSLYQQLIVNIQPLIRIIDNLLTIASFIIRSKDKLYDKNSPINDLFEEDSFDKLKISSRVLGRKAASILMKSDKLKKRILSVLDENIQAPTDSLIAIKWAKEHDWEIEYAINFLEELKFGILDIIDME